MSLPTQSTSLSPLHPIPYFSSVPILSFFHERKLYFLLPVTNSSKLNKPDIPPLLRQTGQPVCLALAKPLLPGLGVGSSRGPADTPGSKTHPFLQEQILEPAAARANLVGAEDRLPRCRTKEDPKDIRRYQTLGDCGGQEEPAVMSG